MISIISIAQIYTITQSNIAKRLVQVNSKLQQIKAIFDKPYVMHQD